jgi:hypothetical protein
MISLGAMNLFGGKVLSQFLNFFDTKTAKNSEITASAAAVLLFAKPSVGRDFRGEQDIDG